MTNDPLSSPDPNRIVLAGDGDGNIHGAREVIESTGATYGVTVLFVDANHEHFPALHAVPIDTHTGLRTISPHGRHLPRGLRWVWHDICWMTLGGAHSVDRSDRRHGVS